MFTVIALAIGSQISALQPFNQLFGKHLESLLIFSNGCWYAIFRCGWRIGVDYDGSDLIPVLPWLWLAMTITSICRTSKKFVMPHVPHPTIVTESGRAMVSHSAVLLLPVLGTDQSKKKFIPIQTWIPFQQPKLWEIFMILSQTIFSPYSDIQQIKEETLALLI